MNDRKILKVPPPLIVITMSGAMWVLNRVAPIYHWAIPPWSYFGPVISGLGFLILAISFRTFRKAKTTIDPIDPRRASQLVTHGIFSVTRNPMYIAFLLVLLGWLVWLGSLSPIVAIAFYLFYTSSFQISREEEALIDKFGPRYRAYMERVPRWIL